jgi:hypothetical protein
VKLFVWQNLFTDHTHGLGVVLAEDEAQARTLLRAALVEHLGYEMLPCEEGDWPFGDIVRGPNRVEELDKPVAFVVTGGG